MIDFVKTVTRCPEIIEHFRNHHLLEWRISEDRFNKFDCEVVKTKTVREYKGIKFNFYDQRLDIYFRPHYFFNDNLHNANDFNANDCIMVMLEFERLFNIPLLVFPVINIEFGSNIYSYKKVEDVVSCFYAHDRNEFRSDVGLIHSKRSYKPNGNGTANKYKTFKAYAKSIQHPLYCTADTLRVEIHSKESKFIRKLGINSMADLLLPETYAKLGESLLSEFDNVLLLDNCIVEDGIPKQTFKKLVEYANPFKWAKILTEKNRNQFAREKKKYRQLLDSTGDHLKKKLDIALQEKVYQLSGVC